MRDGGCLGGALARQVDAERGEGRCLRRRGTITARLLSPAELMGTSLREPGILFFWTRYCVDCRRGASVNVILCSMNTPFSMCLVDAEEVKTVETCMIVPR